MRNWKATANRCFEGGKFQEVVSIFKATDVTDLFHFSMIDNARTKKKKKPVSIILKRRSKWTKDAYGSGC